jgi:hypothetical protein
LSAAPPKRNLTSEFTAAVAALQRPTNSQQNTQRRVRNTFKTTAQLIGEGGNWRGRQSENPSLKYLLAQMKDANKKGWLRRAEAQAAMRNVPKKGCHLSKDQKQLLLNLDLALRRTSDEETKALAFAWGLTTQPIYRLRKTTTAINSDMSVDRKTRKDAGESIFTSAEKRKAVYTPFYVFKQMQLNKCRGESISHNDIKARWEDPTYAPREKQLAEVKATELIQQGDRLLKV